MERKIESALLSWKNKNDRMPLIVQGARQVGKTFSLLSFGKRHYANHAYDPTQTDYVRHDRHMLRDHGNDFVTRSNDFQFRGSGRFVFSSQSDLLSAMSNTVPDN